MTTCKNCRPRMRGSAFLFGETEVELCRLHGAATELLAACKNALESLRSWNSIGFSGPAHDAARELYERSPEIQSLVKAIAEAEARP